MKETLQLNRQKEKNNLKGSWTLKTFDSRVWVENTCWLPTKLRSENKPLTDSFQSAKTELLWMDYARLIRLKFLQKELTYIRSKATVPSRLLLYFPPQTKTPSIWLWSERSQPTQDFFEHVKVIKALTFIRGNHLWSKNLILVLSSDAYRLSFHP